MKNTIKPKLFGRGRGDNGMAAAGRAMSWHAAAMRPCRRMRITNHVVPSARPSCRHQALGEDAWRRARARRPAPALSKKRNRALARGKWRRNVEICAPSRRRSRAEAARRAKILSSSRAEMANRGSVMALCARAITSCAEAYLLLAPCRLCEASWRGDFAAAGGRPCLPSGRPIIGGEVKQAARVEAKWWLAEPTSAEASSRAAISVSRYQGICREEKCRGNIARPAEIAAIARQ